MNATLKTMNRPAEILHVDDEADYAEITRECFIIAKQSVNLHRAKDGEQCMAFIRKQGQFADVPTPDIILLDLNMPRMDGREVLAEISRDPDLRHLPVVILTTSQDEREILKMYQLRCSSYIVKPLGFEELIGFVQSFANYWLTVVVLPSTN
jgi:two-component system, chemotaxis family, response regulator Rcp1